MKGTTVNVHDAMINQYTYQTFWSKEDDSFVATVFEFPGLSWLEETPETAVQGLRSLVEEVMEDMLASGEQVPEPVGEREFSGKFNVRIGKSLHRKLAIKAHHEGLSLNQFVLQTLAAAV